MSNATVPNNNVRLMPTTSQTAPTIWGFSERIGVDSGLGAETVGSILSLSILAGFGAALIAAVIGNKYGHVASRSIKSGKTP